MSAERLTIDPENKYPADGLLQVEENALRLIEYLPGALIERTRDAIQINYLAELGIVVLVTAEAFEFRLPTIEWTRGSHGPAPTSRLWRRVEIDDFEETDLAEWVQKALQARQAEWTTCIYCGRPLPPEHRFSENICHSCASEHLGIVY